MRMSFTFLEINLMEITNGGAGNPSVMRAY
jgi:hypothetical protein